MATPKKILFVMPSLDAGGAEKSLVNLLNTIDPGRFDVDVLLFHKRGIFLDALPQNARVLSPGGDFGLFSLGLRPAVISALGKGKAGIALNRLIFAMKHRLIRNSAKAEQKAWKNMAYAMPRLAGRYDAAIAFLEKSSVYYVCEKVTASKKIAFIHNDYHALGLDPGFDRPYLASLDKIFTVSQACEQVLKKTFPQLSPKFAVMLNVVSPSFIRNLSRTGNANDMAEGSILSIGRLQEQKGFDMAIEAFSILVGRGFTGNWYVIGEGSLRGQLQTAIAAKQLEGRFILLGLRENPYPYLEKALLYIQPSRYEGKSIAIDEAKIMGKPIVVTHFSTVEDQISDGRNGLIAQMDAASVAQKIGLLLSDGELRERLSGGLASEHLGTEEEIEKLYKAIEAT